MLRDPPLPNDVEIRTTDFESTAGFLQEGAFPHRVGYGKRLFPRRRVLEAAVFGTYLGILIWAAWVHEPWADEVQSWLLARDLSPLGLVSHQLRHEGSPGLWQLLLWPLAHAHLPIMALTAFGAALAALGVALLIFLSPLPLVLRLLLPFTYYFVYQYAAISRPYNLLLLLACLLAASFSSRFDRPLRYTGILCLICGVSIPSMLIAGTLFLVFLIEAYGRVGEWSRFVALVRYPVALFGAVGLGLLAILWPTRDIASPITNYLVPSPIEFGKNVAAVLFRSSFSGLPWLNAAVIVAVCLWLYRRCRLVNFLLPVIAYVLFSSIKVHQAFFDGLFVVLLVFALWIGYETKPTRLIRLRRGTSALNSLTLGLIVVAGLVQVWWSGLAIVWDTGHNYGPGPAAMRFLAEHRLASDVIATDGEYWPIELQPYLPRGHFDNLAVPGAYYHFSWSEDFSNNLFRPIIDRRAQVLISSPQGYSMKVNPPVPKFAGYRLVTKIPGEVYWPDSRDPGKDDLLIYLRDDIPLLPFTHTAEAG